jgi:hypothetical protein
MKKLSIYKNEILTNELTYSTQELLDEALVTYIANNTFGRAAYSYESEVTPAVYEDQEILDEGDISFDPPQFESVLVAPATYETIEVPAEYEYETEDITAALEMAALIESKIALGALARKTCQDILDLVGGFNLSRELTIEQITTMQQTFSVAEAALRAGRPAYAKVAINAITPDEDLVTTEMKNLCLNLLSAW